MLVANPLHTSIRAKVILESCSITSATSAGMMTNVFYVFNTLRGNSRYIKDPLLNILLKGKVAGYRNHTAEMSQTSVPTPVQE